MADNPLFVYGGMVIITILSIIYIVFLVRSRSTVYYKIISTPSTNVVPLVSSDESEQIKIESDLVHPVTITPNPISIDSNHISFATEPVSFSSNPISFAPNPTPFSPDPVFNNSKPITITQGYQPYQVLPKPPSKPIIISTEQTDKPSKYTPIPFMSSQSNQTPVTFQPRSLITPMVFVPSKPRKTVKFAEEL